MEEKILKYTFNSGQIPVIKGYVVIDIAPQNELVTVTYQRVGKIIPIDVNGKDIRGVVPHYYHNSWEDARRVLPLQRVPIVKGYRPRKKRITPADATVNTAVIYDKVKLDAFPRSGMRFRYSANFGPTSTDVDGWDGNIGPHGEYVDHNGLIVNAQLQVIGYVDSDGKAYYIFSDTEDLNLDLTTRPILSLRLIGLSGLKEKKRRDR